MSGRAAPWPVVARSAVDWLALKCWTPVCRRVLLLARPCDAPPEHATAPPGIAFRVLAAGEEEAYLRFRPRFPAAELARRLARGDRCWAAWHEGRIVHAGFVARGVGPAPYLDARFALGSDDLFSYDSFTARAWRGRGLAPARHAALLAAARDEGSRRVACIVAVENRAGRRALEKAGYRAIAAYRLLRLGPWRLRAVRALGDEPAPLLLDGDRA